jgi:hypothetical protein
LDKKEVYITVDFIDSFEVEEKFGQKCIKFHYNDNNKLLFDFIENFDDRIQKCVKEYENNYDLDLDQYSYLSSIKQDDYINENKFIELKIKSPNIDLGTYNDVTIYVKCNRLWSSTYLKRGEQINSWGISLTIDKIIKNN